MVWLPASNRMRPIELLVDDDARQFMRQCERAETPQALGLAQDFVRQSLGTTLDASGLGTSAAYYRKK